MAIATVAAQMTRPEWAHDPEAFADQGGHGKQLETGRGDPAIGYLF